MLCLKLKSCSLSSIVLSGKTCHTLEHTLLLDLDHRLQESMYNIFENFKVFCINKLC
jgi:hypothetical protein